ncbi:hypothetical protein R1sor_013352 [Riccia sorocarpa]|uniref:Cytochrome P450 n=1 Tax=Riccia sorocarpa TaxID=122646 RepID=A0ABD3H6F0_9MARC
MATSWNNLSSADGSYMTLITVLAFTLLCLLWSVSSYFRCRNRLPVPPGNFGFPFIGQTVELVLAMSTADGIRMWVQKQIEKHGPLFKFRFAGYPMVMLGDEEGNKFIFQNDGMSIHTFLPSKIATLFGPHSLLLQTGERHKLLRRHFSKMFDRAAMSRYIPGVNRNTIRHFTSRWQGKKQLAALDMTNLHTFSTICSLALSLEEGPLMDKTLEALQTWLRGIFSLPINLPGFDYYTALKSRGLIFEVFDRLMEQRRQEIAEDRVPEASQTDFLNWMLTVPDEEGNMFQDSFIRDNLLLLLVAAFETTSAILAMTIFYIAKNPHVYQQILQEQKLISDEKCSGGKDENAMTMEDISAMKYTWKLNWNTQYTHYNPESSKDPLMFDPSRWETRPPPFTYLPFGGGIHSCLGNEFAKMSMLTFIHHLVRNYSWSLVHANYDGPFIRDPCSRPPDKVLISVKQITAS